jgi:hypothetical protein
MTPRARRMRSAINRRARHRASSRPRRHGERERDFEFLEQLQVVFAATCELQRQRLYVGVEDVREQIRYVPSNDGLP